MENPDDEVESKQRRSMLLMDLRISDVRMMQKRRRPLGEWAGQSLDCPSELVQINWIKSGENHFLNNRKKYSFFNLPIILIIETDKQI